MRGYPHTAAKEEQVENPVHIVERYLAAFNETDSDRRRELLNALYGIDADREML